MDCAFAVTGGIGERELADEYKAQGDDYNAIMIQAVADRLAEAFAEYMHEKVRKEIWGYSADEALSNDDLIREKYQGITTSSRLSSLSRAHGKRRVVGATRG